MWLVTREASEGQPLVDALKRRGHEAVCMPAIRRVPLPWPDAMQPFGAVTMFLTSPYAARLVVDNFDHTAVPPPGWAAVEPASAAALRERGIALDVTAPGGSLALCDAVLAHHATQGAWPGRWLWPTSDVGLRTEEHAAVVERARAGGASVDSAAVYTTLPDPQLDANLRLVQGRVRFHAVLFSPSAAHALRDSLARTGVQGLSHVVTVGASTTRAWAGAPSPSVAKVTSAPPGVDIVELLCSLEVP